MISGVENKQIMSRFDVSELLGGTYPPDWARE